MADRGRRMTKEWNSIPAIEINVAAASTFLGGSLAFLIPGTILRMVGEYAIGATNGPSALEGCHVTIGIGLVSTDAFAVGAGSMPDPGGEPAYGWLYWASHTLHFPSADVDGGQNTASLRRSFDMKSMRRFKPGQSLAFVVEYALLGGAPECTIAVGGTRVLIGT